MLNARQSKLQIGDVQMDYITFGKGQKPLVMIQGLNTRSIKGAALPLAYMYRIFAKDYKVYLFDRRENVSQNVSVKDLAADVALAMDELKISCADILGVSQGGMIAQYLAIERPDLVNKLVIAVSLSRNNETVVNAVEGWIEIVERGEIKKLTADMAEKMYSDRYLKIYRPLLPLLAIMQKPKDKERFIALARACLTCDTYKDLKKITCKTLVIGAEKDKIVGSEGSEEMAKALGCRLHMYKDLGHAAYEEAKDFNRMVLDFFKE